MDGPGIDDNEEADCGDAAPGKDWDFGTFLAA